MKTMLQFIANGLCLGAMIAVVGLGFGLIYSTTRVFHIAHAGIYVLSGYVIWVSITLWKLPLAPSILLSLAVAAIAGVLIDWAVYQPLARRSELGVSPKILCAGWSDWRAEANLLFVGMTLGR